MQESGWVLSLRGCWEEEGICADGGQQRLKGRLHGESLEGKLEAAGASSELDTDS